MKFEAHYKCMDGDKLLVGWIDAESKKEALKIAKSNVVVEEVEDNGE